MQKEVIIEGHKIGDNHSPYVIAEVSANHNGDIEQAKAIIKASKEAGAHAIKLQTYTPDTMTLKSDKDDFLLKKGPWAGKTLHALYQSAYTPWEWHAELLQTAKDWKW